MASWLIALDQARSSLQYIHPTDTMLDLTRASNDGGEHFAIIHED